MTFPLLWKDLRVFRVVIAGAAILTLCPYASTLLLEYFYPRSLVHSAAGMRTALSTAAMMALVVTVLMAAVFGAVAFASERRERSAEFLAMLPVTRRAVLRSKLLFAGACVAAMWGANILVLHLLGERQGVTETVQIFGALVLMAFGVGWLFSTFFRNAGLAAGISIGATVLSTWGFAALADAIIEEWRGMHVADVMEAALVSWAIGVGLICLFVGSVYYLRRVEP